MVIVFAKPQAAEEDAEDTPMSPKMLIGLALSATIALLGTACAPVGPTSTDHGKTDEHPGELLSKMPTPTPEPKGPKDRIEAAIDNIRRRELLTTNGFWTIFHGILGLGPSVMLRNPSTDERINAV